MILSASGWRKVFAQSGSEKDTTTEIGKTNASLVALIAKTFADYMKGATGKNNPLVAVAMDTRPTGKEIADITIKTLVKEGLEVEFLGIASAPEIMAYARQLDGFEYISASHNPIGHNGIKFGLNNGGVLEGSETAKLTAVFKSLCARQDAEDYAKELMCGFDKARVDFVYTQSPECKQKALKAYYSFIKTVITGKEEKVEQDKIFDLIKSYCSKNKLSVVCDMNGSSRILSIDKQIFSECGINFIAFNNIPGAIQHEIIPEPENLIYAAQRMTEEQENGNKSALIAYMPDCDGDRGNLVIWNEKNNRSEVIKAQEVFALCVMAECSYSMWVEGDSYKNVKHAVAVNCPTSNRIEEIAKCFNTEVFRAEVGEANVVNLAREKRNLSYSVRILGEGSNGGNITYPSSVRDPLSSVFALIKLLAIKELSYLWYKNCGRENLWNENLSLSDLLESLPEYTTTGVSEERALLYVKAQDKGQLKEKFKILFEKEFIQRQNELKEKYLIEKYDAVLTNGTKEVKAADSWNNASGGLKVRFFDDSENQLAFIWMRPSGTESVFRVMCDVKGKNASMEKDLLEWETKLIYQADKELCD